MAWAACDWNPTWCRETVAPWARANNLITLWSELSSKFNVIEVSQSQMHCDFLSQTLSLSPTHSHTHTRTLHRTCTPMSRWRRTGCRPSGSASPSRSSTSCRTC